MNEHTCPTCDGTGIVEEVRSYFDQHQQQWYLDFKEKPCLGCSHEEPYEPDAWDFDRDFPTYPDSEDLPF
jgi:hypothetical protein